MIAGGKWVDTLLRCFAWAKANKGKIVVIVGKEGHWEVTYKEGQGTRGFTLGELWYDTAEDDIGPLTHRKP